MQHHVHVYLTFWGAVPAGTVHAEDSLFTTLVGSTYNGILTQYYDGTGHISNDVVLAGSWVDPDGPSQSISDTVAAAEIGRAISVNGWTNNGDAQFVLVVAPGASYAAPIYPAGPDCAYHEDDSGLVFSLIPYVGDASLSSYCSGFGPSVTDRITSITSHEYAESATDPDGHGWTAAYSGAYHGYPEIGDLCEPSSGTFGSVYAQDLYSNQAKGCVAPGAAGGEPSPPIVSASARGPSSVTLTWSESGAASSFSVVRDGTTVATTTHDSYVDTHLTPNTFYRYQIVANLNGASAPSAGLVESTTQGPRFRVDLNGDGKVDLAYIYPGSTAYVDSFISKGDGTFTKVLYSLGKGFDAASGTWLTGDVNGDGKTDLLYLYPGSTAYVDTFISQGNGTFKKVAYSLGTGFDARSGTWLTADVNGDHKTDLVYIYPGSTAYIDSLLSLGNGTFNKVVFSLGTGFDARGGNWLTADVNGDHKTDLAYVYPGSTSYIDSFLSLGNGKFSKVLYSLGAFDATSGTWLTADLNGDGRTDLVYVYPGSTAYIDSFISLGTGQFSKVLYSLGSGFNAAGGTWAASDLNGDGKVDLVYVYRGSTAYIDSFISTGTGAFSRSLYPLGAFDAASGRWLSADVTGDHKGDLVYIYPSSTAYLDTFVSRGDGQYSKVLYSLGSFDARSGVWL